jgi:hypothetical protein
LANDFLFTSSFFGPSAVGFNEFNSLFIRDGVSGQAFALLGSEESWGDQALLTGINGPFSFSLSQFASETDGFRANNDDSIRQYDGFIQWNVSPATNLQLEASSFDRESGDLVSTFDPSFFSSVLRSSENVDTQRLGIRRVIAPKSDLLVSIIHQDRHGVVDIPDPLFPFSLSSKQDSIKTEIQYLRDGRRFDLVIGASYFDGDSSEAVTFPPDTFVTPTSPTHVNAYSYLLVAGVGHLPSLQIGASYDDLESDVGDQSEVNPKLGLSWVISDSVVLRGATFRTLKRRINSDQGLEPTQIAGFNQLFDDDNGAIAEGGALALDFRRSTQFFAGLQGMRRDLSVPIELSGEIFFQDRREDVLGAYAYWLANDRTSIVVAPQHSEFRHGANFDEVTMDELPLSYKYFSPSGLWLGITIAGVRQKGRFDRPDGSVERGDEEFWVTDAVVAYRFASRRGTASLEGKNIFDEKFNYQEIAQDVLPRYVPEAQVRVRISWNF